MKCKLSAIAWFIFTDQRLADRSDYHGEDLREGPCRSNSV